MNDHDITQRAFEFLRLYGSEAEQKAMTEAIEMHIKGHHDDEEIWLRIFDAIRDISKVQQPDQNQLN